MEIRIAAENLVKALWVASVALSAIGFLLMLYGLVAALTMNSGARIQEAMTPVAIIAAGAAMSVIPWCLTSSVLKLLDALDGGSESEPANDNPGG